ncbi:hypothetical protein AKJ09_01624 [Labilithrix luteola]|uniref:BNR repeat domain protein n=1 Tax=Labilithrix luteola TaxID=1391654 RepID=A0A0K1PN43_9BACT|nr:hypothetical protein [Labilithrix luteola]AKU94960.1 hypothetical protein AKJ09_01624 [Labilithrix luteola]
MKQRARLLILAATPIAAAVGVFACSSDEERPYFVALADGGSDAPATSIESGAAPGDGGVTDARVPFDAADEPIACTAKPCVTQLVAGLEHFCALLEDKTVRCWGGDIALGTLDGGSSLARPISMGLWDVEQISAGGYTTCARLTAGTVKCWGTSFGNELGLEPPGPDYDSHDPTTVARDGGALDGFVRVDVGRSGVTFAVKTSGELWSWGNNRTNALGRPRELDFWGDAWLGPGPVTYLAGESVASAGGVSTSSSDSVAFAITSDRRLRTWGTSNQMVAYPGPVPTVVDGLENVGSVAATETNICAVADGYLYCWGKNGLLACTGSPSAATSPIAISTRSEVSAQQVSLGVNNTCVRLTDGTVECCGNDKRGQLGRAASDAGSSPSSSAAILTQANAFTGYAVQVAVGSTTVCALVQGERCSAGEATRRASSVRERSTNSDTQRRSPSTSIEARKTP